MQCPGLQHPAVLAYKRATAAVCGVDPAHRCNLSVCRYWQWPGKQQYVCKTALHVHACSDRGCALAVMQHDRSGTGFRACPLSGLEMRAIDYAAPGPSKCVGRGGVRWLNAGTSLPGNCTKRRANLPKPKHTVPVGLVVRTLTHIASAQKYSRLGAIRRLVRKAPTRTAFATLMSQVLQATGSTNPAPAPPQPLVAAVHAYCTAMLPRVQQGTKHVSALTLIAVVCSLLAQGLEANGVQVFPIDPWAAAHTPPLALYSCVPNLQCRAMSVCTRTLKRAIFANGVVTAAYVFPQAQGV
jgi:hypothetical protein